MFPVGKRDGFIKQTLFQMIRVTRWSYAIMWTTILNCSTYRRVNVQVGKIISRPTLDCEWSLIQAKITLQSWRNSREGLPTRGERHGL